MQCLLIDDLRTPDMISGCPDTTIISRTYLDGMRVLIGNKWDVLYLDHDLGDKDDKKTGYGIMCFLEEYPEYLPDKIILVTSNPVGRKNIQMVIDKLYG